ncbi:MAG: 50S ribosomal protein L23 [Solirubrobacterales bacterium]
MDPRTVLIEPVVSEKSYALMSVNKYTFRVHDDAHKIQIAQAVEAVFDVEVAKVRTMSVKSKPKRRGTHNGRTRSWRKAIVELKPGNRIELFEGAATE